MTSQATPSVQNYTIGKGKTYFVEAVAGKVPKPWSAGLAVLLGDRVYTTEGSVYDVATAGTTGLTAPTGTGTGITDGTATIDYVARKDLGNAPKIEFTAEYDTIDHYSSMMGVKTRDLRVITNIRGGLNVTLDEITPDNLSLGLAGSLPTGTAGSQSFDILVGTTRTGILIFEGTNEVGPKYRHLWSNASFTPSKTTGVISDEFVTLELEAFVNKDGGGKFGFVQEI